ncbi:hypothetical protein QQS21_004649 [Conoideocrella luteorostrata]|uniref:FAD-binding domain-containing protein n=1 Tax=Conoideocrella luteorostrata TaxID=1105319 RepID=A0AAJ0CQV9_9HYPO|nr:hypothetical protein QQS21_004649 [Conoideocrella luteorostrata]
MQPIPTSVVVVGGSLAGLMSGIQLKRLGSNVTLLEQEVSSERSSHIAGIGFGLHMKDFLEKYDFTGLATSIAATSTQIAYRKNSNILKFNAPRLLTSWGLLYRILRANFDGHASAACPNPPPAREGEGSVNYRAGKKVTGLEYIDALTTVHYVDVTNGEPGRVTADLVIAADGMHSTIRTLLQPSVTAEYSGYVAWRGTVRENDVLPETREYFANNVTLDLLSDSYILT